MKRYRFLKTVNATTMRPRSNISTALDSWATSVRNFTRFVTMNRFLVGLCCRTAFISRRRSSAALLPMSRQGSWAVSRRGNCLVVVFGIIAFCLFISPIANAQNSEKSLFDGKSLEGWETLETDRHLWRVDSGLITGGSLLKNVPHNSFLATEESFHNFELRLKIRITGTEGFINSGIQIRSVRVPGSHEMSGYQVDAGKDWWGKLYDESRRGKVIGQAANLDAVNNAVKPDGWNEYRILAEGPRIRSWINGVPALDYTETDMNIAQDGHIGIQVHGGGKALVQVKDVTIIELPSTPNAPTWKKVRLPKLSPPKATTKPAANRQANKVSVQMKIQSGVRSPEDEQKGFQVPDGFQVELVASESEGIGKFVAIAFDAKGRMWTMTALEYPVDGNENAESSRRLFAKGGQDKVLVYDKPFGTTAAQPRVFADGLVMPLGILPYKDGVYVQYGNDIRFYRDTNGDGKADKHEIILTGFGTQDSHLFPHQFTRTPGGWILTAQGLFNYSKVHRPDDVAFADGQKEVVFNQTKLARFKPDGSLFELLTAGPNNIWGLTISREGETWLQEANDLGYPIIPYEPGGYYQTGSAERLRSYQPLMPPPLAPLQMGGTGLSGLALADDRDGWPAPWGVNGAEANTSRMFYVANPIISRIQLIRATPGDGRYSYEKLSDFLISEDPRFRPVAIQFGPDGCLYIVDWYNKIISHNEVPRTHPDRDKTRGRIWRVRYNKQPRNTPPDLTQLQDMELLQHLGAPNARIADLAWQEIVDRKAYGLARKLKLLTENRNVAADRRLGALWALEGLQSIPTDLLKMLAKDSNANIRHEAVRIAAAQPRPVREFLSVVTPLNEDPEQKVRAALGDALRRVANPTPEVVGLMARLGRPSLPGKGWPVYGREFERFLARWAMERNTTAVAAFLQSPDGRALPLENRVLATLALDSRDAALGLTKLIPEFERPLAEEEVHILALHSGEPAVADVLEQGLSRPGSREAILRALLSIRTSLDTVRLQDPITRAARDLWSGNSTSKQREFVLKVAGAFGLVALEKEIATFASAPETRTGLKLAALRALREISSTEVATLTEMAGNDRNLPIVRNEALAALAASKSKRAPSALLGLFPKLDNAQRTKSLQKLSSTKTGAQALLDAIQMGKILTTDVNISSLQKMHAWLAGDSQMEGLWREYAGRLQHVLMLNGGNRDFVRKPIALEGPFTVEAWVCLGSGIDNHDGILAAPGTLDMNFHAAHFRVWAGNGQHDVVIAESETVPEVWTHYVVTRDALGTFKIYINGELDAQSTQRNTSAFFGLNIGRTIPSAGGTNAKFTEFRVWNMERTANEIRDNFDRAFADEPRPKGLVHHLTDQSWGNLSGNACAEPSLDVPVLLSAAQARVQQKKFTKYRTLAEKTGNTRLGKELFTALCLTCHQQGGTGGQIAPPLDGVGLTGTDALLRNLLTPNAAMEGGYRMYCVETRDGELVEGLLVSKNATAIVLRQPNIADHRILQSDVKHAAFTTKSIMPEGLLEALQPEQVTDLFTFLLSLQ